MFRTHGDYSETHGVLSMSFRDSSGWLHSDDGGLDFAFNIILMGDDAVGPALILTTVDPGVELPRSVAHGHASDNWRISLLGEFHMGPETYRPGHFRLQQGWRTYPDDDNACGPKGGWELLFFADRRGMRRRLAVEPEEFEYPEEEALRRAARFFGFSGDVLSDDPSDGAGPSAIASTLATPSYTKLRMGKLNGSFDDSDNWIDAGSGTKIAVTLMGDRSDGPILLFADTKAENIFLPSLPLRTELFRLVVEGSCKAGSRTLVKGDMLIQRAGERSMAAHTLEEGMKEVIIIGNRSQFLEEDAGYGWPSRLRDIVRDLADALKAA